MKKFNHAPLPFAPDALEPFIDAETVALHHGKHHLGYVNGANGVLGALVKARESGDFGAVKGLTRDLAFHVSGALLHELYWAMMGAAGDTQPEGAFAAQIQADFGSFDAFKDQFTAVTVAAEGSGWGVLSWEPVTAQLLIGFAEVHQHATFRGATPLLVCDVWEHAYYLKYQNRRADYVKAWWHLVQWPAVARRWAEVKG